MNKYFNWRNYITYFMNRLNYATSTFISPIELRLSTKFTLNENTAHQPVIIILGAPRSGTTILYQILTDFYDIGYLSNIHCAFFGAPALLELLLNPLKWRHHSDYTSSYGLTRGLTAPSECERFWFRFFGPEFQYAPIETNNPQKILHLREAIRALAIAFRKPLLLKSNRCALRLQSIAKALPETIFIVTHRNILDTGHSILRTRKEVKGNYESWWGTQPPLVHELKELEPHIQVVEQIRRIYQLIEAEKKIVGSDRFIDIHYEDFCSDTHQTINKIEAFFLKNNVRCGKRTDYRIPALLEKTRRVMIDNTLYSKLLDYVQVTRKDQTT